MSEALSIQMTQFKAEMAKMMAMFNAMDARMTALEARYGITTPQATQQSTPPAPQETKKEEDKKTRPQPLYQATVEDAEDDAESIKEKQTEHQYGSSKLSSNKPDSKITLPTIPRLCTTPSSEDSAASLSNALHFVTQYTLTLVRTQFSYIRCMGGMEATGQG